MKISDNGLAFIIREEGKRNDAYHDSRGLLTIGVGHLVRPSDDIHLGDAISDERVEELLSQDLGTVQNRISWDVAVTISQNQFDALCSLVFNIGAGAFSASTVLRELNAGNVQAAADGFLLWKRAGSNPNALLHRRQRERALFLTPDPVAADQPTAPLPAAQEPGNG